MRERRPNLGLHVRAPGEEIAPSATITDNRAALEALRELVDAALRGEGGNASRVFREVDGADYQLEVRLARKPRGDGRPRGARDVAGIIPDAAATPPQDAPGAGTGEHHGPDVRRTTGDAELGRKLRALRRLDGRGLKESAHACGVSVSALSEYERAELKAPRARYWTTSARLGTFGGCPRRWTASTSTARNATATGARRTSSS